MSQRMLIVDCLESEFRCVKIRGRSPDCIVCGQRPLLLLNNLATYDYTSFTGQRFEEDSNRLPQQLSPGSERLTPRELLAKIEQRATHPFVLLDIRSPSEFAICRLKGAKPRDGDSLVHMCHVITGSTLCPFRHLDKLLPSVVESHQRLDEQKSEDDDADMEVVVVCRRGNDSQLAVAELKKLGILQAIDLAGGLEAWHHEVDSTFLKY